MKKLFFILLSCVFIGLTACQSTPGSVERDGIEKAVDKIEDEANRYLGNSSTTDESELNSGEDVSSSTSSKKDDSTATPIQSNTQGQSPYQTQPNQPVSAIQKVVASIPATYKKTLSGGNGAIIDAKVIVPDSVTQLGRYSADYRKVDLNALKGYFFGNRTVNNASGGYECMMDDGFLATLIYSGLGNFGFTWSSEYKNYPVLTAKDNNHAPGCSKSLSDAQAISSDLLKILKVTDFRIKSSKILPQQETYGKRQQTGSYELTYHQYVDNLPIVTDTANLFDRYASIFQIYINDRGIYSTMMLGWELTKTDDVKNILSLDQAVSLIKKKLPSLWLSQYVPIMEISLEYMLNQTADGQLYVAPCWHFCVDKRAYYKLSQAEQRKHDSNDLAMDAVTGEMFRVGDRYIFN